VTQLTIAERIVQELLRTRLPLDDDELARRLDVRPRQTINQACRRLEQSR
jgi:DNA-binding GntR family transcriptional regulator